MFASPSGGTAATCTVIDKCSFSHALELVDTTHKLIRLDAGTYNFSTISIAQDLTLIGRDAVLASVGGAGSAPVISISGGATVALDFVTVEGGSSSVNHGIACAASKLTLAGVIVQGNFGEGLDSNGCDIAIQRATFAGNRQGAIHLDGANTSIRVEITNTMIHHNGNPSDALFGGIYILPQNISGSIEFNTVVDNYASNNANHFPGVLCDASGFKAANNIVARNTINGMQTDAQVVGACMFPTSIVQRDVAGVDFASPDAQPYSYKIGASSSARDQATTPSPVDVDFEADPRPQGAAKDIGADEFVP